MCPSNSVKFSVDIRNNDGGINNDVDNDLFYFQVNGPISRAPALYRIDATKFAGDAIIEAGTSQTFIFPDHFKSEGGSSLAPLDLSTPVGPYTITASITIPDDPDLSNNVSTSLDIGVFTPAVPSLSSSADPDNIICAGDPITFTITPFSATATYTFKVNNGIVQSLFGVNSITFTTGALGNIANGDVVTIDMIDGNGCVTSSATQSRTVTVSSLPTAGLSSSAPDGLFCSGDVVSFEAIGGVSYKWYVNGTEQFGATFSNFTRALSNNDIVSVRVFNAAGCFDEKSLTFQPNVTY